MEILSYKGYIIMFGRDDWYYVSKGGYHICMTKTLEEAKKSIDELL